MAEPLDGETHQLPEAWGTMHEDDEFTAEFTNPLFTEMNDSMAYAVQPPSPSANGSSGRPGSSLSMDASSLSAYQQRMKDVRFRRRARQPRGTSSVDEKSFLKDYNDNLMETLIVRVEVGKGEAPSVVAPSPWCGFIVLCHDKNEYIFFYAEIISL